MTTAPLTAEDYGWLLGSTRRSIKERERAIRNQERRPVDNPRAQRAMLEKKREGLTRAREVEQKLLALLAAVGRDDLVETPPHGYRTFQPAESHA